MNRFSWSSDSLFPGESYVTHQSTVRLYDGDVKTQFEDGVLTLTSHRILWKDATGQGSTFSMPLSLIIFAESESGGFTGSAKSVVHLNPAPPDSLPGPVAHSFNNHLKFSFKGGGHVEFHRCLEEALRKRQWELDNLARKSPNAPEPGAATGKKIRSGIVGIERRREERSRATDANITQAFEDLSELMKKAKDMVSLSKSISEKIKNKQGDITEDETVKFKSYLLSLGIEDPVTRQTHGSGDRYYVQLAKQTSTVMEPVLKDCGGMMTLTDVYCRVNRARGMELLSPDDLLNACELMEVCHLPVVLRTFESGVKVLQLTSLSNERTCQETSESVEKNDCLSAEEFAQLAGLPVVLAKERLLSAETYGRLCRDDSIQGLRFYPNLFLTRADS